MKSLLYEELVRFYHLLDPLADHEDEAEELGMVLKQAVPAARRLLELGAGAGHGAHFIKALFGELCLSDLSPAMLARSEAINPDCEHIVGDMRTLRLSRQFDCVLIHDAISYLTTRDELAETARTAYEHLCAGGAALLVPDAVKESFKDSYEDHAGDDHERSLRCLSWSHDPDPSDDTHITDFVFLLREKGRDVEAVHDRHVHGLFSIDTWIEICAGVGFSVETVSRPLPDEYKDSAYTDKMFLCRKKG